MQQTTIIHTEDYLVFLTLATLFLPLVSFVVAVCIKPQYAWLASLTSSLFLFACAVSAIIVSSSLWDQPSHIEINWFTIGNLSFTANIYLANHSLLMLSVVTVISCLVHLYSIGYMAGDENLRRYFAMLGFFTFSMLGIVLAENLLLLFVFWELVGFSSYMLIGHWMNKPAAGHAARKAFILNRIGDAAFIIGLMITITHLQSLSLSDLLLSQETSSWQTIASLCIFGGVIGKSAQLPLFTWLPDAMEGPTPVSALIHAATMVAAGVYLLIQVFPLFTPASLQVVAITGGLTAVIGSIAALYQYDIKHILAYSTISQLGLMIMAIGMKSVDQALLHLFTHAFFKAGLFLCAGAVIHALHHAQLRAHHYFDVQDIRNLAGLRKKMPVTFLTGVFCAASLAGIPFFSGFLSKEAMLISYFNEEGNLKWFAVSVFFVVTFLTTLYTFRFIWKIFFGSNQRIESLPIEEVPPIMKSPLMILAVASSWLMVSINPFHAEGWLYIERSGSLLVTIVSLGWIVLALAVAYRVREKNYRTNKVLENGFYIDRAYQLLFQKALRFNERSIAKVDDRVIDGAIHASAYAQISIAHIVGWIDKYIVDGIVHVFAWLAETLGALIRSFQSGKIQLYIFWAVFAIIIFLISMLN